MSRSNFNFSRKIFHMAGLLVPLFLYLDVFAGVGGYTHASRLVILIALLIGLDLLITLEVFRFSSPSFSNFFWKYFGILMKESEKERMNATIPYFVANIFVILFLPPEIATLSLLFLIVGDPSAAYFGSQYGKRRFSNGKSLEGILGFFGAAFVFGLILLAVFSATRPDSLYSLWNANGLSIPNFCLLVFGVLVAGVAEFVSGTSWKGFLDDNLLIPIASGLAMALVSYVLLPEGNQDLIFSPYLLLDKLP